MTGSMQEMLPVGWLKARSRDTWKSRIEEGCSVLYAEVSCLSLTSLYMRCFGRTLLDVFRSLSDRAVDGAATKHAARPNPWPSRHREKDVQCGRC